MQHRDYLGGDCQRLAAAIQDATGWPVALIDGGGEHVVIETPGGQYLDYAGLHTADELRETWRVIGGDLADIEHIGQIDQLGWLGTDVKRVDLEAAQRVLDDAGLLTPKMSEWIQWRINAQAGD